MLFRLLSSSFSAKIKNLSYFSQYVKYIQGQTPLPNVREYFYFIDHQGMLFLDDSKMKNFTSCFKEKKFLQFFFKRLKMNSSGRYEKYFPYVSLCGKEVNYVRCDDLPIVFTHVFQEGGNPEEYLSYGYAGNLLRIKFEPERLCMLPDSGRVYHPGPETVGGIGLIKSSLAIELSRHFIYRTGNTDEMPISFMWDNKKHDLTNDILEKLHKKVENI